MPEVVAILLAAGVGAISGILTTSWKTRKDLESEYDIDLRRHRIDAYMPTGSFGITWSRSRTTRRPPS